MSIAGSLAGAQLSIGTATAGVAQTYTSVVNVSLASGGARIAALQFDLAYDRTALTVAIAEGSTSTAALMSIASNDLGTVQRAVVFGGQSGTPPRSTVFADGVVATLTVTVAANASLGNRVLTLTNLVAADPNANAVPLTGVNGAVNVAATYMVGDVYPYTGDAAGSFGNGQLNIQDLTQVLFAVTGIPGYKPAACSDRLDAMDTYPVDTPTARGGDGILNIQDLIRELFRATGLDSARPVRASLGGCATSESLVAEGKTRRVRVPASIPVDGTLVLGEPQNSGVAEERVPVYLEARRDLLRVAVTVGLGDGQSPLYFEAADTPPSLSQEGQPGAVALAWLQGITVPAGGRLLLGYVTGPAGMSARLRVYGVSAGGLDDGREVRLDASARTAQ
jgi:hypothetical protein